MDSSPIKAISYQHIAKILHQEKLLIHDLPLIEFDEWNNKHNYNCQKSTYNDDKFKKFDYTTSTRDNKVDESKQFNSFNMEMFGKREKYYPF